MFEALWTGLTLVFQWPSIGYLLLGASLGIWVGAIPGLGGIIGLVLLLPFTFGMDTVPAFALLLGMWTVITTSDTIASVMLGSPDRRPPRQRFLTAIPWLRRDMRHGPSVPRLRYRLLGVSSAPWCWRFPYLWSPPSSCHLDHLNCSCWVCWA